MCSSRKYPPLTPTTEGHRKFQGRGGWQKQNFSKKTMELNWKFGKGGGVGGVQTFLGGGREWIHIFSGTTHVFIIMTCGFLCIFIHCKFILQFTNLSSRTVKCTFIFIDLSLWKTPTGSRHERLNQHTLKQERTFPYHHLQVQYVSASNCTG